MSKYKLDPTKYGFEQLGSLVTQIPKYIDIFSEQRFIKVFTQSKSNRRCNWLLLEMGLQGSLQEETRITIKHGIWDCGEFIEPKLVYYGNIDNDNFFQHLITQI